MIAPIFNKDTGYMLELKYDLRNKAVCKPKQIVWIPNTLDVEKPGKFLRAVPCIAALVTMSIVDVHL